MSRCSCAACGLKFSSVSAFDRHRTGSFAVTAGHSSRRCRTVAEMLKVGLVLRGDSATWHRGSMSESEKRRRKGNGRKSSKIK